MYLFFDNFIPIYPNSSHPLPPSNMPPSLLHALTRFGLGCLFSSVSPHTQRCSWFRLLKWLVLLVWSHSGNHRYLWGKWLSRVKRDTFRKTLPQHIWLPFILSPPHGCSWVLRGGARLPQVYQLGLSTQKRLLFLITLSRHSDKYPCINREAEAQKGLTGWNHAVQEGQEKVLPQLRSLSSRVLLRAEKQLSGWTYVHYTVHCFTGKSITTTALKHGYSLKTAGFQRLSYSFVK